MVEKSVDNKFREDVEVSSHGPVRGTIQALTRRLRKIKRNLSQDRMHSGQGLN
jgi:hypothetical protein